MRRLWLNAVLTGLFGCYAFSGCDKPDGASPGKDVVAKVGSNTITLGQFEGEINSQNPLIRSRYNSQDQKVKLLESMVEREAMVMEAKRLGLDKDPEVMDGFKKILARHLVNAEFNQKRAKQVDVTDAEIDSYYKENADRYHAPEKVRVHQIFFKGPAADPKARKEAKKRAEDIFKQLKAQASDRRVFLDVAREKSEDEATKAIAGDMNFKSREQLEQEVGKKFAEAAFALTQVNDLSATVEEEKGFHLLRLSGKQAAIDLPLDKVKGQIRTTLIARARSDAYRKYVEEVKQRFSVQLFAEVLQKAKVEASGEGQPGMGRFVPPSMGAGGMGGPGGMTPMPVPPPQIMGQPGQPGGKPSAPPQPGK